MSRKLKRPLKYPNLAAFMAYAYESKMTPSAFQHVLQQIGYGFSLNDLEKYQAEHFEEAAQAQLPTDHFDAYTAGFNEALALLREGKIDAQGNEIKPQAANT